MAFLVTFFLALLSWVILSARFDPFHLGLGVLASFLVALSSSRTLFPKGRREVSRLFRVLPGAIGYGFWLMYQITLANLHVFYLATHPRMKQLISPQWVRFKTVLKSDFSKFILANSITLTPGTVTIRIDDDEFLVHAISDKAASELPGEMQRRIASVFEG